MGEAEIMDNSEILSFWQILAPRLTAHATNKIKQEVQTIKLNNMKLTMGK